MDGITDDGGLSSDFTVHDNEQTLWIGVRPVWHGNKPGAVTVQVCYQDSGGPLQGPVFISEDTWRAVNRAVTWRLRSRRPLLKRIAWSLTGRK